MRYSLFTVPLLTVQAEAAAAAFHDVINQEQQQHQQQQQQRVGRARPMQNCSVQSRDKEGSAAGGNSAATAMPAATATRAGSIVGSSTGSKTPRRAHQYQRDANVRDMFTERER